MFLYEKSINLQAAHYLYHRKKHVVSNKVIYRLIALLALLLTPSLLIANGGVSRHYIQPDTLSFSIDFRWDSSILDTKYRHNGTVFKQLQASIDSIGIDNIDSIVIMAHASPDGVYEHNIALARRRGVSTRKYIIRHFPDLTSRIMVSSKGESWNALRERIIQDPKISDASTQRLLDIIDNPSISVGTRKWRIERDPLYKYLYKKHYSSLRNSLLFVIYTRGIYVQCAIPQPQIAELSTTAIEPEAYSPTTVAIPTKYKKPFYMSIKTNMLYDAGLTPNIGMEFHVGNNFSIAANWMYAWWSSDACKWYWRVYGGDIALRKWVGRQANEKPLTGHHIGVYAQILTYDILWGEKGSIAGVPGGNIFDSANYAAGIEYGYSLPITSRLNIDFSLGIGYMWGKYYEYKPIDDCYVWQVIKNRKWIGPTKAEISLVWLIGHNNINAKKGGSNE